MKRILILIPILLLTVIVSGQQFYVNTSPITKADNKTYLLTIDSCDWITDTTTLPIYTCPNTAPIDDIAVDNDEYLWYLCDRKVNNVYYRSLYKRKLSDTVCQFVVQFPFSSINSLVADTAGNIYAAGGYPGGWLFKYDGNNLTVIDSLPKHMVPAGDLFFYNNRLFVTCQSKNEDSTYIAEYNLNYPGHACYYMSLDGLFAYGAFTLYKESTADRVFILSVNKPKYDLSSLIEIDMPNKKILDTLCVYPFLVRGAASAYSAVWNSTACPPASSINEYKASGEKLLVLNPSIDVVRIKSNIKAAEIRSIYLYNVSGKRVKDYKNIDFPNALDISDVPNGLYILQIKAVGGRAWQEKVIKN